jgi:hypothetical protein
MIGADATAPASRDCLELNGRIGVEGRPLGDASLPAASAAGAFIAAFSWQLLSRGATIGAGDGSRGTMGGQLCSRAAVLGDNTDGGF